jgi:hypothetical protein
MGNSLVKANSESQQADFKFMLSLVRDWFPSGGGYGYNDYQGTKRRLARLFPLEQ